MGMINGQMIKAGIKVVGGFCKRNLPSILIYTGLVTIIVGTVDAVKRSPEAFDDLENQKGEELQVADILECEPKKDIWARAKIIAKHYWVPGVKIGIGSAMIIFGDCKHISKEAALLVALGARTKDLDALREKIVNLDGKDHLIKLEDEISKERAAKEATANITYKGGDLWCRDATTGNEWLTTILDVERAEVKLHKRILHSDCASLNSFYDDVGAKNVDLGSLLGWSNNGPKQLPEILKTWGTRENGDPMLIIRYDVEPKENFDTFG